MQQEPKSYSTFHSLLANPDIVKTDQRASRKLSELSTNINPTSINPTDSNTGSKADIHIDPIRTQNSDNTQDIAPTLEPEPEPIYITMGAQSKPICCIVFDYFICALFGASYYMISNYMTIRSQCIPGNDSNPSHCNMEDKSALLNYPYTTSPVPTSYPYIFGAVTWCIVILFSLFTLKPSLQHFTAIFIKMEAMFREVLSSVIVTQTIVGFIKSFVGRPRPNYYKYHMHDASDAISSFPSGHASSSFCIHILLVYHVLGAIYWSFENNQKVCTVDNMHSLFGAKLWQKTRCVVYWNV